MRLSEYPNFNQMCDQHITNDTHKKIVRLLKNDKAYISSTFITILLSDTITQQYLEKAIAEKTIVIIKNIPTTNNKHINSDWYLFDQVKNALYGNGYKPSRQRINGVITRVWLHTDPTL